MFQAGAEVSLSPTASQRAQKTQPSQGGLVGTFQLNPKRMDKDSNVLEWQPKLYHFYIYVFVGLNWGGLEMCLGIFALSFYIDVQYCFFWTGLFSRLMPHVLSMFI